MEFWDGADEASWDEAQRRLFDLGVTGLYGYTVGFASDGEWIGVEFQLRTT